jgi:hypothetical protein
MKNIITTLSALLIGIFMAVPFQILHPLINKEFVFPLMVAIPSIKAVP